jgi:hypothetical protein
MGQNPRHVIAAVRHAFKEGFLQWSPRIMLAVYNVDIQAASFPPLLETNDSRAIRKLYAAVKTTRTN